MKVVSKVFNCLQSRLMIKVVVPANTGGELFTSDHARNWMEYILSRKQPNPPAGAAIVDNY